MSKKEFKKDIKNCRVIAIPKKVKRNSNGDEKVVYDIYKMQ